MVRNYLWLNKESAETNRGQEKAEIAEIKPVIGRNNLWSGISKGQTRKQDTSHGQELGKVKSGISRNKLWPGTSHGHPGN